MSVGRVLIIGSHPVLDDVVRQFRLAGREVTIAAEDRCDGTVGAQDYDELVILSRCGGDAVCEDNRALGLLAALASQRDPDGGERPVAHLLLQSGTTLRMLQDMDFPPAINDAFEVSPFTMEDVWAQNIFVRLPGAETGIYPSLDREPVTSDSPKFVHLVIGGFDAQARAAAVHAALVAHYPNYDGADDVPLRTRITVIEKDITAARDAFVATYQPLFDHSFYRTVYPAARRTELHKPVYDGRRTDFVDVEWEFVDAATDHAEVRRKIAAWASDAGRLLTMVISHESDERNLAEAMSLPAEVFEHDIPVFVRQAHAGLAGMAARSVRGRSIRPFGMKDCGYDVTRPLTQMAKLLKYFYDCSYGDRGVPTELPRREVEAAWRSERSFTMRFSNLCNVMTIRSKMHSLGRAESDDATFYALTRDEIETLARTEHNRWSVERLITGSRPCTDAERDEIGRNIADIVAARKEGRPLPADLKRMYKRERNVHYDLCAYDELGPDATGKNVKTYDYDLTACIPLIVKSFLDNKRNG